ncbi:MAG: hypothetical protein G8345_11935, partial [Magnetococcales bacterium]|nr:hypothetical protein [Magnetococcales bacterium]
MTIHTSSLSFALNNLNMWGPGTVGVDSTTDTWALNIAQRYNLNAWVLNLDSSLTAALGIRTSLQGTTGDVDLRNDYVANIYYPTYALAGQRVEINTSDWFSNYRSLVSTSPNFQFNMDLMYQFDLASSLNVKTPFGSRSVGSLSFGTGGLRSLPLLHVGMDPSGNSPDYFNLQVLNFSTSLPSDAGLNLDVSGMPLHGYLRLPGGVQTNTNDSGLVYHGDEFSSYGTSDPFFQFGLDVDQMVGMFFGIDTSVLEGRFSLPAGLGSVSYELLDLDLNAELSLAQEFTFDPGNIVVQMTANTGESHTGVLGDTFFFNTPDDANGALTINTDYYLSGILTNQTGLNGQILVDLDVLNFGRLALIDQVTPLFNTDLYIFETDIPLGFTPNHDSFTIQYRNDYTASSGPSDLVLGSDNGIEFLTDTTSDFTFNLSGLDQTMLFYLMGFRAGSSNLELISTALTVDDTATVVRNIVPAGRWTAYFEPLISDIDFIGDAGAPGFNINYTVSRTNRAPTFIGSSSATALENHSATLNYGGWFRDLDASLGDTLSYAFSQANGSPLPSWMKINTADQTIMVTPPTNAENINLRITATDLFGASATGNVAISTPAPPDSAGNTMASARQLGALGMDSWQTFSDYVGSDDGYDYYSFTTNASSSIELSISTMASSADVNVTLLNSSGAGVGTSFSDYGIESVLLNNAAPGTYYARVQSIAGHSDYSLTVTNKPVDMGGNSQALATLIPLTNQRIYHLADYLSASDTTDWYRFQLDSPAVVRLYNTDTSNYSSLVYSNGNSFGYAPVNGGSQFWGAGNQYIQITPDVTSYTTTRWVRSGFFGGYYVTETHYNTASGNADLYASIDRLPYLANPTPDRTVSFGIPFSFSVGNDVFRDSDGDYILTSATLSNGAALPSWIQYNAFTKTFSGTAPAGTSPFAIRLTGRSSDPSLPIAEDYFTITPTIYDAVGNSQASAMVINVGNSLVNTSVISTDGNDYFRVQVDSGPLMLNISGVAASAKVTLMNGSGGTLQTWLANSQGNVNQPTTALLAGTFYLRVETAASSNGYNLMVNGGYEPPVPSVGNMEAQSDSGFSNTDDLTRITTPVIAGTAPAGTLVRLYDGVQLVGTSTSDAQGNWRVTTSQLANGNHNLVAKSVDSSGNLSTSSAVLAIMVDTLAPTATMPDLVSGSDSGRSVTDNITNLYSPVLAGQGEAGALVQIYDGQQGIGTTNVDASGSWSFAASNLVEGQHLLSITMTDRAGNVSTFSPAMTLVTDYVAPDMPIIQEIGSDLGRSVTDNITNDATLVLSGSAEADALVAIYRDGELVDSVLA